MPLLLLPYDFSAIQDMSCALEPLKPLFPNFNIERRLLKGKCSAFLENQRTEVVTSITDVKVINVWDHYIYVLMLGS